jgi:L-histidine N-alpha-methyltransferase
MTDWTPEELGGKHELTGVASPSPGVRIDVQLRNGSLATLNEDVREGLGSRPKTLPPKYFYDERGSELFERITELPEYYPTRAEQVILDRVGREIVDGVRPRELVELGPGSARKTHALLDPMVDSGVGRTYVPVDVSETAVEQTAARLADTYDGLRIHGVVGDFERHLDRVPRDGGRRLVAFLGGTLGNLEELERRVLLRAVRRELGPQDRLLVGTDLVKDKSRLEAAYNDSEGVTAEFNRNVLNVINANLDGNFEPQRFDHVAHYDERLERIEMRLRAREAHSARIHQLALDVEFQRGEDIRTEISCKFTHRRLSREYAAAGLELLEWHTDPEGLFALSLTAPSGV